MTLVLAPHFTQINLLWTAWKTLYNSKGGVYQYQDDGIITTVWFYDTPEVYYTIMWDGTVPAGVVSSGYTQAQNNSDLLDFQTNWLAGANKRISRTDGYGDPITIEFPWAAVQGIIPGVTISRATGYLSTSTTGGKPVRATTYSPQGTNAQRSLKSSNANDTSAGTGARTIQINYLNTSFQLKQDTVTLNGTTAVATNATDIAFIESLVVVTCGSTGGNVGNISLWTSTTGTGTNWASIATTDNMTFYCHHYIPAGVNCYITNVSCGATANTGSFTLQHSGNPLSTNTPIYNIGGWYNHLSGGSEDHAYTFPVVISGPDYIFLLENPGGVTSSNVYGSFEYVQF